MTGRRGACHIAVRRNMHPLESSEIERMDVRYINPFVESVCNTFETMCGMKVDVKNPELKCALGPMTDVSGVIGFSGDATGCVVLHFDFVTASNVATAFAGTEIDQHHEDFADAIGELANMVAGGAKAKFDGVDISVSLPNVIIGKAHNVTTAKNDKRIIIPCQTAAGAFTVEIGMVINKQTSSTQSAAAVGVNP